MVVCNSVYVTSRREVHEMERNRNGLEWNEEATKSTVKGRRAGRKGGGSREGPLTGARRGPNQPLRLLSVCKSVRYWFSPTTDVGTTCTWSMAGGRSAVRRGWSAVVSRTRCFSRFTQTVARCTSQWATALPQPPSDLSMIIDNDRRSSGRSARIRSPTSFDIEGAAILDGIFDRVMDASVKRWIAITVDAPYRFRFLRFVQIGCVQSVFG